jgi:ParB-like chromosome segregation protein Spo0J
MIMATAASKRAEVQKDNAVLDKLQITYVGVNDIRPNTYNPNRQSEHDFELLCKSIASDGFTQPVIVNRASNEIVDGEHRWRACKALGFVEVPIVYTDMSAAQMKISTLRHNRARGSEDAGLVTELFRELAEMGAIDAVKEELIMDDVEMQRLLGDMSGDELKDLSIDVPTDMLGPSGHGLTEGDMNSSVDTEADERRARERILEAAKKTEEQAMSTQDKDVYRLMLIYTGPEADDVQAALKMIGGETTAEGDKDTLPRAVLALCQAQKTAA